MGIDKATIHRIGRQTIRGENTPQGDNTLIVPRRNVHAPVQEWAYNTTGYELKAGYIVEVTDFDPDQNKYTIQRPSADGLSNIAVVKSSLTPAGNGNRVELQFSGTSLLWYSGTAPTIADTVGSQKDSFLVKIGANGFAPLESGATVGGSGRCRARFFSAPGLTFQPFIFNFFDMTDDGMSDYVSLTYPITLQPGDYVLMGINVQFTSKYFNGTGIVGSTANSIYLYTSTNDLIKRVDFINRPDIVDTTAYASASVSGTIDGIEIGHKSVLISSFVLGGTSTLIATKFKFVWYGTGEVLLARVSPVPEYSPFGGILRLPQGSL